MSDFYVNETYRDGDKELYMPYWKQILEGEVTNHRTVNLESERQSSQEIHENEIAMKHPKTGSVIKLRDDGSIEMYVNEDTGIRMDPNENTIIFYGDVIHMATKETRIHTKPYQFLWNNHNFNPYLYYGDKIDDERYIPKTQIQYTSNENGSLVQKEKYIPFFQEQSRKNYYDDEVKDLFKEIGIKDAREVRNQ